MALYKVKYFRIIENVYGRLYLCDIMYKYRIFWYHDAHTRNWVNDAF